MFDHIHKIQKSDSLGLAASLPIVPRSGLTPLQLQDNRPNTVAQRKIQKEKTNSNPTGNNKVYQRMININSVVQRNNDYTGTGSTGPVEVIIPSGEQAMLFTSANELLPLSQNPRFQLDLINNKAGVGDNKNIIPRSNRKILFKGLPWPDPGIIDMTELNGRPVYASPMYIYL